MSIIAQQSVGNVIYAQISEDYPVFSASTAYVAINQKGKMFTNVPNSSMWFPLDKETYSEMQTWDNAIASTTVVTSSTDPSVWFLWSGTFAPTATTLNGFTVGGSGGSTSVALSAHSSTTGRFLSTALNSFSILAIAASDQTNYEIMPILNDNLYLPTLEGNQYWGLNTDGVPDLANGRATIITDRVMDIDGNANDYLKTSFAYYTTPGYAMAAGTIYYRNYKLGTRLLEEATVLSYDNWESGIDGWTTVNDTTNKWNVGTGTSYSGLYSLYISTGTSVSSQNIYNTSVASVSHVYKDVTFPVGAYGTGDTLTPKYISLKWKSLGSSNDYGAVYITPKSYIPTAGTEVSSTYLIDVLSGSSSFIGDKTLFSTLPLDIINTGATSFTAITETWESSSFANWNVVNGATNVWVVGSAVATGGTYSAYISNDAGTSNAYTNTVATVSHFYRDITIPSTATNVQLKYNWRCNGENGSLETYYDYGTVVIAATTTTPVGGTEVSTTLAAAAGNGRIGATANLGKFNLTYSAYTGGWFTETINLNSYTGSTKRLIFTWVNDTSLGANPPMAIDNILLTYNGFSIIPLEPQASKRVIFSWINSGSGGSQPPLAIDDIKIYCYPAVPNDKIL